MTLGEAHAALVDRKKRIRGLTLVVQLEGAPATKRLSGR
jgi:hypothetical protein